MILYLSKIYQKIFQSKTVSRIRLRSKKNFTMKIQKRVFETLGLLPAIFWNQITRINCFNISNEKRIWCINVRLMHVNRPFWSFFVVFLVFYFSFVFFCLFAFLSFQCSLMGIYQTSRTRPKRRDPCEYCEQQDLRPDGIFLGLVVVAIQIDLHEMPYWAAAFVFPTFFYSFSIFKFIPQLLGWKLSGHWTTASLRIRPNIWAPQLLSQGV